MRVTLTIASVVLLLAAAGEPAAAALAWEPGALAAGEPWRWLTGHLVHAGPSHLAWDLVVFVPLSLLLERWSRPRLLIALAAALIPLSLAVFQPGLSAYRGVSGLDAALLAAACAEAWRRGRLSGRITLLLAAGSAAKLAWEFTGTAAFATLPTGWTPVPLAHAAGTAAGLLASLSPSFSAAGDRPPRRQL